MELSALVGRVKLRYLEGEDVPSDDVIGEMLQTVIDRITIRMETTTELPETAGSIVVDAAHEGSKAARLRGQHVGIGVGWRFHVQLVHRRHLEGVFRRACVLEANHEPQRH